ncbi:MAG: PilC/PilY family type IV pilus protein [Myxococcota bacterium]
MSNRRMRERRSLDPARRAVAWLVALAAVVGAGQAGAQTEDDIFLFTSSVAPNVLIQLDNSGSMDEIVWHPLFDPAAAYDCNVFSAATTYVLGSSSNFTFCGRTRRLYHDTASTGGTRYTGAYLNWYFSSANTVQAQIDDSSNGVRVCQGPGSPTYAKYQINRLSAAKRVVLDTMCEVLETKNIRFGLAVFREPRDASGVDPNGGYVEVGINDNTPAHANDLEASVLNTKADTWTPLSESLFQGYTYFMSRNAADLPAGATSGTFPVYSYRLTPSSGGGAYTTTTSQIPASPIDYTCQKNFVIVITDGFHDDGRLRLRSGRTAYGFSNFGNLIGDYNADGEVETPGGGNEPSLYLDDIAKFMHENDCRPDMDGDQTLDVYTIGFTTDATANALLQKTAQQGNGLFFTSNNAEELRARLVAAINDIIEKAQSFTAATVPSTRTTSGGSFYSSYFLPSGKSAFWEGHLRAFRIDSVGDVYGQSNVCAYLDPDPGECNSGPQNPAVVPFWDAGEQIPATASRKLLTTKLVSGTPTRVAFDTSLVAADLGLQAFAAAPAPAPNPVYPGTFALNAEGLADEVVQFVRGCTFGTGTSGANVQATRACVDRPWRLGDVFHSGPAVVGAPRAPYSDASYEAFKTAWANRLRVIYAGSNDGFLHAFNAGALDTLVTPPQYQAGTGVELFGFMPWEVRRNIKNLAIDDPTARTYYVDGSPQVVDVWMRNSATDTSKSSTEWKTVLVGGLRQGGRAYYALDVTDPSAAGYPGYLWEFPNESDPDDVSIATSILPYLGQSWSRPIITRVKVKIDSDDNSGAGYERWVAIVAGGYDPTSDPNDAAYDPTAIAGRAILMIDIASGQLLAMKRYDALATDAQADMDYAVSSTPAVLDLNYDGFADIVYVGDLGGQVFKWVIRDIGEDRVNDSSSAGDYSQPNWPLKTFFRAPVVTFGGDSYYKSFFYPPQAVYLGRLLYLAFGSGERMNVGYFGDATEDENNRFYSMTDRDPYELNVSPYATLTEANLTEVNDSSTCADVNGRGFFFKVRDGEKFVTNAEIFNRYVFAGTFQPTTSGDPCTSKGNGRLYAFRVDCGLPLFLDNLGNPKKDVDIGEGMPTDPKVSVGVDGEDNRIYIEKSGADLESIGAPDLDFDDGSLIYWREVD